MHVSVLPDSEARRSSSCGLRRRSVLSLAADTVSVIGDCHCTATCDSSFKDGRKISVGDCALFEPRQHCPPFIGLIRWLKLSDEKKLLLGVNWLYRPSQLNLKKEASVDATPNEIFYSFHKDEIPASSILHPCKVAFLPEGIELPNGTSFFVCRRVYDIGNKCLWWLTDQNFTNEQREEVNQLFHKTKTEMHATFQPDGRSPKQANGSTSTSQLKPTSDNGQNSGTFPSQVKGKKRERVDHVADSVKRERTSKTEDGEFLHYKTENKLKCEITTITEKGGAVNLEGVEKLVQLMAGERKMDLVSRSMLAGVMAATDRVDCLNRFVQLRGLPVLDEWLQDIHKRKIGDGNNDNNSLKDSDKPIEEFLLVLLRALDKLPVNLHALQMCNIGRSVNHLRSHKNLDIQKKARSLVDTWKKRVEAEMISIDDTRSSKSRLLTVTQNPSSKSTSARSAQGENNTTKPTASSSPKDGQPFLTSSTRSRKVSVIGSRKEAGSGKSHKTAVVEKFSQPVLSSGGERVLDGPVNEGPVNHKLIVKIPNRVSSPAAQGGVGGASVEDTTSSQVSSPHEQFDHTVKDKNDMYQNAAMDIKENSCMVTGDSRGLIDGPPKKELLSGGKLHASSFGPMNALVESCAKYSEATSSLSDDVGMNLLASVATGEMSRSDLVSPNDSTEKSTHDAVQGVCIGDEAKSKYSSKLVAEAQMNLCDTEIDEKEHEEISVGEINTRVVSSSMSLRSSVDPKREICDMPNEKVNDFEKNEKNYEVVASSKINADGVSICESDGINDVTMADEKTTCTDHEAKPTVEVNVPNQFSEGNCKNDAPNQFSEGNCKNDATDLQQMLSSPSVKSESEEYARLLESELETGDKVKEPDEKGKFERLNFDSTGEANNNMLDSCSTSINDPKKNHEEANAEEEEKAEVSSSSKMKFDLNEGFSNEDEDEEYVGATNVDTVNYSSSRFPLNSSHPASITVVSPAKGPFVPIDELLKSKGEVVRWKGSAATSAFRPAEPRKVDPPFIATASSSKHGRVLFDFDLNVPDERLLEEMASRDSAMAVSTPVRLDLDLNRVDEVSDNGVCSSSNCVDVGRNFDLNIDESGVDETGLLSNINSNNQQIKGNVPARQVSSSVAGLRMNGPLGLSWFPPGNNTYSAATFPIPSMLPDHRRGGGEQSFSIFPPNALPLQQRGFAPPTLVTPDVYRGSVLSSSPAMSFPPSAPFQFPVFPFPVGGSSYVDSASAPRMFAPSQFQRPFMVGGPESNRKWARQGLDLNAGPESEARPETLPLSSSTHTQVLTEEHARMLYSGIFKPDGSLENQNFRYM